MSKKVGGISAEERKHLAEKLRSKMQESKQPTSEPIAVIGLGCRFPGGIIDAKTFWKVLNHGVDAITEIKDDRWSHTQYYDANPETPGKTNAKWGGFVDGIEKFDNTFFSISPREAEALDPQQRLTLECAWEALEDAGIPPKSLVESQTGVFMGASTLDYFGLPSPQALSAYSGTGGNASGISGRVSYFLGLNGPCLSVNTACSSSLVSVHLACQSLRSKESNLALAGGVHLNITPEYWIILSKARMLSPDGRCMAFDERANGFVRSEGCGILVLKRLSDALSDEDNVLAVIRGSSVNQDGSSGGITVPSELAQRRLLRQAINSAGVKPSDVSYIEAHGTGTSLGDPIEIQAIANVMSEGRNSERPLYIGSVKSNIGHAESAAGVAGLIKVVLSLRNKTIPMSLHVKKLNPMLNLDAIPARVPTSTTPWNPRSEQAGGKRIAGVSSFGFTGTNAHVILEEAPDLNQTKETAWPGPHFVAVSAKSSLSLDKLVEGFKCQLQETPGQIERIAYTSRAGRSHFENRLVALGNSSEEVARALDSWQKRSSSPGLIESSGSVSQVPKTTFLFAGQGSQYVGMGKKLFDAQPVFQQTLEACAAQLAGSLDQPLLPILFEGNESDSRLNNTKYTQPALFAIEYALSEMWKSWGVEPSYVMGHSVGEFVAGCVAGVFSLEDGLKLIAKRASLIGGLPAGGGMLATDASLSFVEATISRLGKGVTIAALNGPGNIVLSGRLEILEKAKVELSNTGARCKFLQVSHGFHSELMDPILDEFESFCSGIKMNRSKIPLISNLTGKQVSADEITSPRYWRRHLREAVRFERGMQTLMEVGCRCFLEIGPGSTLVSLGKEVVSSAPLTWLTSLRKSRPDTEQVLEAAGHLFVNGVDLNWSDFPVRSSRSRTSIPTYFFDRQTFWITQERSLGTAVHTGAIQKSEEHSGKRVEPAAPARAQDEFVERLKTAVGSRRKLILTEAISQRAAALLGWRGAVETLPDQSLLDLGMDSLMATDLRAYVRSLIGSGASLPARVIHEHPKISDLVEFLQKDSEIGGQPVVGQTVISSRKIFQYLGKTDSVRVNLIAFHHAGGSAEAFLGWRDRLPSDVGLVAAQLPGRLGENETAPLSIEKIVEQMAGEIGPFLDKPTVFLGVSLGTVVAFELIRFLMKNKIKLPERFFAMSCAAPHLLVSNGTFANMTDEAFLEMIEKRFGGLPKEVTGDRDMLEALLPVLRRDMEIVANYKYRESQPLSVELTVAGGKSDPALVNRPLEEWKKYAGSGFQHHVFSGGHFFFREVPDEFFGFLLERLARSDKAAA